MERERERMKEVWERLKKEQKALTEVKEEMSKLMARGTTDIWRLKSRMAEQLREYEGNIVAAAAEDDQSRRQEKGWPKRERRSWRRKDPKLDMPGL